jgi:iron complex transport system substrate-binding protein
MVGQAEQGLVRIEAMRAGLQAIEAAASRLPRRPRVYFEEWDEPPISAIRWVSELVGIAGGDDCFAELANEPLARTASSPTRRRSCGAAPTSSSAPGVARNSGPRKSLRARAGRKCRAVRDGQLFEIKSADILQPGPAALTDGVAQLHRIIQDWSERHG